MIATTAEMHCQIDGLITHYAPGAVHHCVCRYNNNKESNSFFFLFFFFRKLLVIVVVVFFVFIFCCCCVVVLLLAVVFFFDSNTRQPTSQAMRRERRLCIVENKMNKDYSKENVTVAVFDLLCGGKLRKEHTIVIGLQDRDVFVEERRSILVDDKGAIVSDDTLCLDRFRYDHSRWYKV